MTATTLMTIALGCGANIEEARMIDALAMKESSRQWNPKGHNDGGKAWGMFQFHEARWKEHSKARWKHADNREQVATMLRCLRWYRARYKCPIDLDPEGWVVWYGRWHNIGHAKCSGGLLHTPYTRVLWKFYKANREAARRLIKP